MSNKSKALTRAHGFFLATERRDEVVKAELARERAAVDVKTAKLRVLRLAKEEADRQAKIAFDAANPPPPPRRRKAAAAKTS